MMDESIEVVICHDILAVPCHDTTEYVWAATQTFTIRHLPDDDEGAGTINGDAVVANGKSDFPTDQSRQLLCDNSGDIKPAGENPSKSVVVDTSTFSGKEPTIEALKAFRYSSHNGKKEPNTSPNGMAINAKALSEHFSFFDDNKTSVQPAKGTTDEADYKPPGSKQTYCCGVCEKPFQDKVLMHTHRIEHFGYFGFKDRWKLCSLCEGKFHDLEQFSDHLFHQHYETASLERRRRKRKQRPGQNQLPNEERNNSVSALRNSIEPQLHSHPIPSDANQFNLLDATPGTQKQQNLSYNILEASSSPPFSNGSAVINHSLELDKGMFYKNFPTTNNDRLVISPSSVFSSSAILKLTDSKCEMPSSNNTSDTVPIYGTYET